MTKENNYKTQLSSTLNSLISRRETWESGVYKQANAELYEILTKCGEVYAELKEDTPSLRAFKALVDDQGIQFNRGTSLALKIVRLVFGAQTNREFAYARVIKLWFDQREDGQSLSSFVIEQGGVENVRRRAGSASAHKLTPDDYREIATDVFSQGKEISSFPLNDSMLVDEDNDTDFMVVLVHNSGQGIGRVVAGTNKRSLVNSALAVMGKQVHSQEKQEQSLLDHRSHKQAVASNIQRFLADQHRELAAA